MPVTVSVNCPEYILLFIPRNNSIIILVSFTDDKADFSSLSSLAALTELVSGRARSPTQIFLSPSLDSGIQREKNQGIIK